MYLSIRVYIGRRGPGVNYAPSNLSYKTKVQGRSEQDCLKWQNHGDPLVVQRLGPRAVTAVPGAQLLVGELRSCTLRGEAINK